MKRPLSFLWLLLWTAGAVVASSVNGATAQVVETQPKTQRNHTSKHIAGNAMTEEKQDLAEHGLVLLISGEAGFQEGLAKHGFTQPPSYETVVVKNISSKGVAAFGVQRLGYCADGREIPLRRSALTSPQALLDMGQPNRQDREPLIEAGGSRIVSRGEILSGFPTGRNRASLWAEAIPACEIVREVTRTDLVVYEDGTAYGPDSIQVLQTLEKHIAAQQDLVEEISGRMAKGESADRILSSLTQALPLRGSIQPPVSLEMLPFIN